jgi:hypothetical protein
MSEKKPRAAKLVPIDPPRKYMAVETHLHRALLPFSRHNLAFIEQIGINVICNLSNRDVQLGMQEFAAKNSIRVYNMLTPGECMPFSSGGVSFAEDWMIQTTELIISLGSAKVLLVSDTLAPLDAAVIACIRRLQSWSLTSIIAEFRMIAGRDLFDIEQFIEYFNPFLVSIPTDQRPEYLQTYIDIEDTENQYLDMLETFVLPPTPPLVNEHESEDKEGEGKNKEKDKKKKDKKKDKDKDKDKDKSRGKGEIYDNKGNVDSDSGATRSLFGETEVGLAVEAPEDPTLNIKENEEIIDEEESAPEKKSKEASIERKLILFNKLFNPHPSMRLISPGVCIDPNISLVNDAEVDD